jgi:hypothetical protein
MSDLRVGAVVEGDTDLVLIQAVLKAILPRPFVLSPLQPERTLPKMGTGWGGVFRWCRAFAAGGYSCLMDNPRLAGFDLLIIHLDADVAGRSDADLGREMEQQAGTASRPNLPCLPSEIACPPPANAVNAMRTRLLAWLGVPQPGPRVALCLPSKATDVWLAAVRLDPSDLFHAGLECHPDPATLLATLPISRRVKKKSKREYLLHADQVTREWSRIVSVCSQAQCFDSEVRSAIS